MTIIMELILDGENHLSKFIGKRFCKYIIFKNMRCGIFSKYKKYNWNYENNKKIKYDDWSFSITENKVDRIILRNVISIPRIPREIFNFKNLAVLNVSNCYLKSIPKEINTLHNLESLFAFNNVIKSIPKEIFELKHLKNLSLFVNLITNIPEEIGDSNVMYVNLSRNKIRSIPVTVFNNKLKILNLNNNPIIYSSDKSHFNKSLIINTN